MMIKSLLLTIAISVGTAYEAPMQQLNPVQITYEQILKHNATCDRIAIDLHARLCHKIVKLEIDEKTKRSLIDYSYNLYLSYINGIISVHYMQYLSANEQEILGYYGNLPKRFPIADQKENPIKFPIVKISRLDTSSIPQMTTSTKK